MGGCLSANNTISNKIKELEGQSGMPGTKPIFLIADEKPKNITAREKLTNMFGGSFKIKRNQYATKSLKSTFNTIDNQVRKSKRISKLNLE